MPAFSASAPNTLNQFSPYGSLKPMKPIVFTPFFAMCLISAAAIRSSFCVVLNTQRFFASSGSTTADVPTVAISGTLASAMMSRIASALGVVDGPIIASMLFSWISFLTFCTARVVSPPSSSWMYSMVASPILRRQEVAGVLLRDADRRGRTGRRDHQADLDLRGGGKRCDEGRDEQRGETDHGAGSGRERAAILAARRGAARTRRASVAIARRAARPAARDRAS